MRPSSASLPALLYTVLVLSLGLYVFLSGFLLRRNAFSDRARRCESAGSDGADPCAVPATYRRSVLLIVDALRHDFLVYNESLPAAAAAPHQNKMPHVHALLTERPNHTARYRFVADAPTTTMQRLKGLTTGSLPTFVDVGDNFASYEITEDTWLWQAGAAGGRAVFAGDDTWMQLFPSAFARAAPFPSFDISDLDTVDRGVERELARELPRRDWTLLIGHMLGVDHCGHTFGPDHPQMARKLAEVDLLVRNITHQLDNDTILFVLGDHGMTRTGDHGGDSAAEVDAGLLVVSGRPLPAAAAARPDAIPQVDLVPTLSALLGLPIPFSNLGTVRAELLPAALRAPALAANVRQVDAYLRRLEWPQPPAAPDAAAPPPVAEQFLAEARRRCAQVWATFDTGLMAAGVVLLALAALLAAALALLAPALPAETVLSAQRGVLLVTPLLAAPVLAVGWQLEAAAPVLALLLAAAAVTATVGVCALRLRSAVVALVGRRGWPRPGPRGVVASLLLLVHGASFFSNSFTVSEDRVTAFVTVTALLAHLLPVAGGVRVARSLPQLVAAFSSGLLVRLGWLGFACREEQWWCEPGLVHRPLASLQDNSYRNGRLSMAAASLLLVLLAHRAFLRHCGNLNGFSVTELVARWCGWLSAAGLLGCWALQAIEPAAVALLAPAQRRLPVLLALGAAGLALTVLVARPLLVYVRPELAGQRLVTRVFHRLRHQLSGAPGELRVFGLGSAVSAALLTALLAGWLPLVLLLGDGRTPAAALGLALTALAAVLVGADGVTAGGDWSAAVLWAELASFQFFATGHQATFPSIQWDAAVTGLQMAPEGTLLPGLCVLLSTFAGELVAAVTLPLVLCAPHLFKVLTERATGSRGELALLLDPDTTMQRLLSLNMLYMVAKAVKLILCCLAAAILRRHLMVWKIFAPKVLFEGASFLVAGTGVLLTHAFMLRVVRHAGGWLEQLASKEIL
ncbi:GPI ethanolamine phosphate transferase 3-like [Amphibalanus amphitrite]|uniref:GPI ethanolamine phosphate transferase 3-like n=1 Tax=Amphibalanus amphitrite TaxID=1232801 RepID=UPI001C90E86B|nr:GPI ethanolamine phosphate transferase 3-like [Amphibalanus amphitrite]